jgi:two-component system, LuxR family, sensor kinase FixL
MHRLSSDQGWDGLGRLMRPLLRARRQVVLGWSLFIIAVIAAIDWQVHLNLPLGFLYLIPIMLASLWLDRWQIFLMTAACTTLREIFGPFLSDPHAFSQLTLVFITFTFGGLLSHELAAARRQLAEQVELRREAETQLLRLIESSPAAIVTLDKDGRVELANRAAHEILELEPPALEGRAIGDFLPLLKDLLGSEEAERPFRSVMNCRGKRATGETFMAGVWFSSYPTRLGRRMAMILTDMSEDLRDWQEASLQNLLRNSRLLVGSVSHEIRNFCAAIQVVHKNLGRIPEVARTEDYAALATLAEGLSRVATVELQSAGDTEIDRLLLTDILDELRVIVESSCAEEGITIVWLLPDRPVVVAGDHHSLLQVFLNLVRNSQRAMAGSQRKEIEISVKVAGEVVMIRFRDTGPGVANPESLFRPFQPGADNTGLGLFVSRTMVRACDGELYHEAGGEGCTMAVRLTALPESEAAPADPMTEAHV